MPGVAVAVGVEGDLRAVERPLRPLGIDRAGHAPLVAAVGVHDEDAVRPVAVAGEDDLIPLGRPVGHGVGRWAVGQPSLLRPVGLHDVDLRLAVAIGGVGDALPVGRPHRPDVVALVVGQLAQVGSIGGDGEDLEVAVAVGGEDDAPEAAVGLGVNLGRRAAGQAQLQAQPAVGGEDLPAGVRAIAGNGPTTPIEDVVAGARRGRVVNRGRRGLAGARRVGQGVAGQLVIDRRRAGRRFRLRGGRQGRQQTKQQDKGDQTKRLPGDHDDAPSVTSVARRWVAGHAQRWPSTPRRPVEKNAYPYHNPFPPRRNPRPRVFSSHL